MSHERLRTLVLAQSRAPATRAIPLSVVRELADVCRANGATLALALLTAFDVLLHRLTGQSQVIVATPMASWCGTEWTGGTGSRRSDLVLRTDLSGNPPFAAALARVRRAMLAGSGRRDAPSSRAASRADGADWAGGAPPCRACFRMTDEHDDGGSETDAHDLTLAVMEAGDELTIRMAHDARRFAAVDVAEIADQFAGLLAQVGAAPDTPVDALSLLTPRAKALLDDPAADLPAPGMVPIVRLFDEVAAAAPGRLAITQEGRALTYGELQRWSRAIAAALPPTGPARVVVAVSGPRSFGLVAAALAVLHTRCVLLLVDPALPPLRRRTMLRASAARHLLWIGPEPPHDLATWCDEPGQMRVHCVDPDTDAASAGPHAANTTGPDPEPPSAEHAAYVFFTSGSSGAPKAVLGSHKGLSHFLTWQRNEFGVGPGDRVAQLTALSFDVVMRDLWLPLTSGATLCLPDRNDELVGARILPWLERARITIVHAVPTLALSWLEGMGSGPQHSDLRLVLFAGEPLHDSLVVRCRRAFGPDCTFVNLYGPTETTLAKYFARIDDPPSPGIQPVGRALPQTQTLLLTRGGPLAGIGEVGEIAIRTPFRTLGYLDDQGGASRFVANPFTHDPGDLVYRTGDRGRYRSDGTLEVLGRMDDQVKIRGVRVEPAEVAAVLSEHAAIHACTVVARTNTDGEYVLHAYVVPQRAAGLRRADLRRHLGQRLPAAMIPGVFVVMDALPLLPNGKVDRAALPEPGAGDRDGVADYAAARDPLERDLVEIWEDVLGKRPIGVDDDFFALGGHSLQAAQLLARMARRLGRTIPLVSIFETPTIAALARSLHEVPACKHPAGVFSFHAEGRLQPLFALPGIGGTAAFTFRNLARDLGADQPMHALDLRGLDGIAKPDRTVEAMAAHHVQTIRRLEPRGPYSLIGYSFGGRLAFEVAHQLRADGEEVALLAMIDSAAPGFPRVEPLRRRLVLHLGQVVARGLPGGTKYLGGCARRVLERGARAVTAFLPRRATNTFADRLEALDRTTTEASRRYAPDPYVGDLILFRSQEQPQWLGSSHDDRCNGWGAFIRGRIEVHAIPGGHRDAIKADSTRTIAQRLRAALTASPLRAT